MDAINENKHKNTKNCLSNSSSSNEGNSIHNEWDNVNLNYPFFPPQNNITNLQRQNSNNSSNNSSDSFDDDEEEEEENPEEQFNTNDFIPFLGNKDENELNKKFMIKIFGGNENTNINAIDLNKNYLLEMLAFYPEKKMWNVTDKINSFTKDLTAFELFEFLCFKINNNCKLDDLIVVHKKFQKSSKYGILQLFNILSEFLNNYYKTSLSKLCTDNLKQKIEQQNINQVHQNYNQNNFGEPINNWHFANFNICNNNNNNNFGFGF
jgi:hypothetical protein